MNSNSSNVYDFDTKHLQKSRKEDGIVELPVPVDGKWISERVETNRISLSANLECRRLLLSAASMSRQGQY